jgi:hypothetical protein
MAEAAPNYREHEEYWKPVAAPRPEAVPRTEAESSCPRCQTGMMPGSKFCHHCGLEITVDPTPVSPLPLWLDFTSLCQRLGQNTASLVGLILGCACLTAAVATGFFFTVATLSDWQAVQLWRIQWLLAAIALFAGGILLRRR